MGMTFEQATELAKKHKATNLGRWTRPYRSTFFVEIEDVIWQGPTWEDAFFRAGIDAVTGERIESDFKYMMTRTDLPKS